MKHKRLKIEEREQIAILLAKKKGYREIGRLVGKSHSTIVREVQLLGRGPSK